MNKNNLTHIVSLLLGVCVMSLMVGYIVLAWTDPSSTPPAGNVPAPINIGSTGQTKTGNLTLTNLYLNAIGNEGSIYNTNIIQGYNDLILLGNASKNVPIYLEGNPVIINNDAGTGNVGIGTTGPGAKLEVQYPLNTAGLILKSPGYDGDSLNGGLTFSSTADSGQQGSVVFYHRGAGDPGLDIWGYPSNSVPSCCVMIAHFGNNGNVGIGTANPGYKLDVVSGGVTTARFGTNSNDKVVIGGGVGKLDVGTVDPIFEIDGKKYATYMADYAGGTRVETSGIIKLEIRNSDLEIGGANGQYVINLDKLEVGSDLWLFWQASNKNIDDAIVLLTSGFDGKAWYEKTGNSIVIYGDKSGEVSYRLSVPRFDHQKWNNLADDQNSEGFKISDY